jgi:DNA topoisomerase-1
MALLIAGVAGGMGRRSAVAAEPGAIPVKHFELQSINNSFDLSTLRKRHVSVQGSTVEFQFRGKGGQRRHLLLKSTHLARMVAQCLQSPGSRLFKYAVTADDGTEKYSVVKSTDVNEFLQRIARQPFTAKDFRMWQASTIAAEHLYEHRHERRVRRRLARVQSVIKLAAERLANT